MALAVDCRADNSGVCSGEPTEGGTSAARPDPAVAVCATDV